MQVEPENESICPRIALEKNLTISSEQMVVLVGRSKERRANSELPTSELMRELEEYISTEGRITGRETSTPAHISTANCAPNPANSRLFLNASLE